MNNRRNAYTEVYIILKDTLEYLQKKGGSIDVMTNKAYEFYRSLYE